MAGVTKDIGPCEVTFKGTSVGPTYGSVEFTPTINTSGIKENRHGEADVDDVFTGGNCTAKVPLTRSTLAQLETLIPGATVSGNRMRVQNKVGSLASANEGVLILKPIVDNVVSTDSAEWTTIHRASPIPEMTHTYSVGEQRVTSVMFKGYPVITADDPAGTAVGDLWDIGETP